MDDVIFAYTRADALDDGVLVDVSHAAREAGFVIPVAVTSTVFATLVEVPANLDGQDEEGRLWDILTCLRFAIKQIAGNPNRITFTVLVRNSRTRTESCQLVSVCGPGDEGEPVITIMFPGEE
jgi:hypothetical protein